MFCYFPYMALWKAGFGQQKSKYDQEQREKRSRVGENIYTEETLSAT